MGLRQRGPDGFFSLIFSDARLKVPYLAIINRRSGRGDSGDSSGDHELLVDPAMFNLGTLSSEPSMLLLLHFYR